MANTVLKFRDQTIRMNYRDLAEILAVLNQRLETVFSVGQVTEPWLSHMQEDLGYMLLDASLLDRPGVISKFEMALTKLSSDLRTGNVSPHTSRWTNVSNDMREQSAYLQHMQAVIRDLRSAFLLSERDRSTSNHFSLPKLIGFCHRHRRPVQTRPNS